MPIGIYTRTPEMYDFRRGKPAWNSGKKNIYSKESLLKMSEVAKRRFVNPQNHPLYGKKHSQESLLKMRLAKLGKKASLETRQKMSMIRTGKHHSLITKMRMAQAQMGEKSHLWQGGKKFELYAVGWTRTHREQIRYRDNYKCQICGIPEIECERRLHVHHIDYDKKNIKPDSLISLCQSCHGKTNHGDKNYWMKLLREKLNGSKIY